MVFECKPSQFRIILLHGTRSSFFLDFQIRFKYEPFKGRHGYSELRFSLGDELYTSSTVYQQFAMFKIALMYTLYGYHNPTSYLRPYVPKGEDKLPKINLLLSKEKFPSHIKGLVHWKSQRGCLRSKSLTTYLTPAEFPNFRGILSWNRLYKTSPTGIAKKNNQLYYSPVDFLSMKWQWTYGPTLLPLNNHFHTSEACLKPL